MKYVLVERIIRLGLAFFIGILSARILGEDDYGTLALALSIGQLALIITNLGVDGLLVREYTRFPNYRFLQSVIQLQFLASVLTFWLCQLFWVLFPIINWFLFTLVISQVLILPLYNLGYFLEAQSRFKPYGIALISSVLTTSLLRLLILSNDFIEDKLTALALTYCIEILIASIMFSRFLDMNIIRGILAKIRRKLILSILSKSRSSFFSALIGFIIIKMDLILVATLTNSQLVSVGDIALSVRLQDAIAVIIFSYIQVQSPLLYKSHQGETPTNFQKCTKRILIIVATFCILYMILSQLFIDDFVLALVGAEFIDAPRVFLARNIFFIGIIIGQVAHVYILLDRDYKMIFYKSLFFLVMYTACLMILFLSNDYLIYIKTFGLLTLIVNLLFLSHYYIRSVSSFKSTQPSL
jgi:O-antigen/teichoic acid export membrane protein